MCVSMCMVGNEMGHENTVLDTYFVFGTMLDSFTQNFMVWLVGEGQRLVDWVRKGNERGQYGCTLHVQNFYTEVKLSDVVLEVLEDLLRVKQNKQIS